MAINWDNLWSDPAALIGLTGTLLGMGGNIYGNVLGQRGYNRQVDTAAQTNAIIRDIMARNAANNAARTAAINGWMGQAFGLMGERPNWRDYYEPMTQMSETAIRRGVNTNAQTRGFSDSAYADAMVGEGIAKSENDRVLAAMGLADRSYAARLGALGPLLGAAGGLYGDMSYPPGFAMPPSNPYQPSNATGGFGNVLQWKQIQDAIDKARGGGGPGQTSTPVSYSGYYPEPSFSLYGDANPAWYSPAPFFGGQMPGGNFDLGGYSLYGN